MKILHRFTRECLFEADADSIRELVEKAVRSNADLSYADLRNADLSNAYLRNADLSNADLRKADLRYAYLRYADLSYADLRNADLRNAYLRNADLRKADLRYAYLRYADLRRQLYMDLNLARLQKWSALELHELFSKYLTSRQLCHTPVDEFLSLCGCKELSYISDACLHWTFGDCHTDEMIFCIPYADPHKSITKHKKGECPHTEYKRKG